MDDKYLDKLAKDILLYVKVKPNWKASREDKKHKLYGTWLGMLDRCYSPNNSLFYRYGRRGIRVHEDWWTFETFANDMGARSVGYYGDKLFDMTIDRINTYEGYSKENCRWATMEQQLSNRRRAKRRSADERKYILCNAFNW